VVRISGLKKLALGLKKTILAILSFVLIIISCRHRINWKNLSQEDLENFRKEFNLPKEKTFRLDTNYIRYLFHFDTIRYADQIKNHYQPIQALYYDRNGQLVSFHINCYAGIDVPGKDDLNWNQENAFATFLPKSVAPFDSILPLMKHLSFIKTFDNKPIDTIGFSAFDYTIIIHWGKRWRPKDSKNLIKIVSDNANLAFDKKLNILYVNSDDALR
jgi:hypothetical protein